MSVFSQRSVYLFVFILKKKKGLRDPVPITRWMSIGKINYQQFEKFVKHCPMTTSIFWEALLIRTTSVWGSLEIHLCFDADIGYQIFYVSWCCSLYPRCPKNPTHCMPSVAAISYLDMDYMKPIKRTGNKSQNVNILVTWKRKKNIIFIGDLICLKLIMIII